MKIPTASFVLDNSVAMSWCFKDETNPYADAILQRLVNERAIVPPIWPLEVANVLLVAERRRRIRRSDGVRFLSLLAQLPISVDDMSTANAMTSLLTLGRETDLSSYDASYLDLAMRQGCPMATLDANLREAARDLGVPILEG